MAFLRYCALELKNLNSHIVPGNGSLVIIKSLHLLRRPPYVHRAVRHKLVYVDTSQTIPVVRSITTRRQRHQNEPRIHLLNLQPVEQAADATSHANSSVLKSVSFMLLNTRSLNNKAPLIHDIITDRKLDFLCLTETWQNQMDLIALNQATPQGYSYIQKPRSSGRGGGLAVIHHEDFHIKEFPVHTSSFECIHFALTGPLRLQVVLVYRPPKASPSFLPELSDLLALICPTFPSTVLLGQLISRPPSCTVDDLVTHYNRALSHSLDSVAPLITRSV
ncbi:hypothetical protein F2P79_009272 [Pimephales promelas]|nr:hypothetical protein F2P79_009272 [Pimephales promelas]